MPNKYENSATFQKQYSDESLIASMTREPTTFHVSWLRWRALDPEKHTMARSGFHRRLKQISKEGKVLKKHLASRAKNKTGNTAWTKVTGYFVPPT